MKLHKPDAKKGKERSGGKGDERETEGSGKEREGWKKNEEDEKKVGRQEKGKGRIGREMKCGEGKGKRRKEREVGRRRNEKESERRKTEINVKSK